MILGFVGGGLMAEAIIKGCLDKQVLSPQEIRVVDPSEDRRIHLSKTFDIQVYEEVADAINHADIIIIATKPQHLEEVSSQLKGIIESNQVVLSILAGIKIDTLTQAFNHEAVIRVMPNTPAQVGMGMSVWTTTNKVSSSIKDATETILESLGEQVYVAQETYLDMATAVSASGPAYVFLFIEAMIDAGVYLGLPRDTAKKLVLQTVQGSCQLALSSAQHPAQLKDAVTSPGGTTAAALLVLEQREFKAAVMQAIIAAYDKSNKLGAR
ncbi:MAG: pyrroline-5-carboxylate reductase [Dehalococcoidia bacterium]|jgi:pyrroline-5-carboxylate reductase|nr:pyrroline-5-carboxylate reductase [Dehalococcoidia bacterium]